MLGKNLLLIVGPLFKPRSDGGSSHCDTSLLGRRAFRVWVACTARFQYS